MNVEKCAKGHMYDASIYSSCPYCRMSLRPEAQVNQAAETVMRAASASAGGYETSRGARPLYGGYEVNQSARDSEEAKLAAAREIVEKAEAERIAELERIREERLAEAKKAADTAKYIESSTVSEAKDDRVPCPKCGFPSKIGSKFCRNCGEKLVAAEKVEAEIVDTEPQGMIVEPSEVEAETVIQTEQEFIKYTSGVNNEEPETEYKQPNFTLVKEKTPVVGWLVCVEGEHYGDSFEIRKGDRIRVGNEKFVLVPLVGNGFEWK